MNKLYQIAAITLILTASSQQLQASEVWNKLTHFLETGSDSSDSESEATPYSSPRKHKHIQQDSPATPQSTESGFYGGMGSPQSDISDKNAHPSNAHNPLQAPLITDDIESGRNRPSRPYSPGQPHKNIHCAKISACIGCCSLLVGATIGLGIYYLEVPK